MMIQEEYMEVIKPLREQGWTLAVLASIRTRDRGASEFAVGEREKPRL